MNNKLLLHLFFWTLIAGITIGVASGIMSLERALLVTLVHISVYSIAYYTNTLFLFPRYYKESNIKMYILFVMFLVVIATFLLFTLELYIADNFDNTSEFVKKPIILIAARSFFWLVLIVVVGTVFLIQKRLREQLILHKEIEENKLKTELKLLRSQINPHFLFNALNNIYSLSYLKSEKAPESIVKLSNMLRYVIEDCANETIYLKSEIEYIENYIAFQKMKSPDDMNVVFNYDQLLNNPEVTPMLFIPFIENSFKYSKIEEFQNATITIELKSNNNKTITFSIVNSIPPTAKARSGSGTGISNVKQRLDILYPGRHNLTINESYEKYSVTLNIETNET